MNKLILTLAMNLLAVTFLFAQVSINNDNSSPDPSAMLDVKSNSKGLLAPRVALTAINVSDPIQAPALGLLVFNTVNAGTPPNNVVVGYYFWNGNRWIQSAAPLGVSLGDLQYWNGSQWITVPAGLPGQFLQMSQANIPVWAGSSFATIITTTPYNISASGAISGGTITSDGGSAITAKGICYNTAPNPTLANFKLTAGSGTNSFSANITGLVANTTYYIRAYATNTAGTAYGNEVVFTTLPEATVPVITTTAISSIAATTATSGGSIINNGGAAVTARGVCWSTSSNPTITGNKTINGSGNGGFSSNLTGLTPNTLYYVRAYATNSAGTGYGNELFFTTLCSSYVTASVSITVSTNPVCQGASVNFNATSTNGGTAPTYQWKVNGNNATGATNTSYNYTPVQGDAVTCVMTSNLGCVNGNPATSNAITMTVNPQVSASVTIAASANPVCEGTAVTFTATPVNGGTNPSYQWKLNGNNVQGATTATYQFLPTNNDAISCTMYSTAACVTGNPAISNTLTMSVTTAQPVSVVITASENPVNAGTSVTFTAMTTNGGTNPSFQWKVNGVSVGDNSQTYIYTPQNSDSVLCIVTSSIVCASGNPAISNPIIMSIIPGVPCPGIPIVTYEGKTYHTVQIGEQCWLRENLDVGTQIPYTQPQTNNNTLEKFCYNNDAQNCAKYGGLYQWAEAVQYLNNATNTTSWIPIPSGQVQGICPSGWHIPSNDEWSALTSFLGGVNIAGGKMKETGTVHWTSPNVNATNSSGFTALPGGFVNHFSVLQDIDSSAIFWAASEYSPIKSHYRSVGYSNEHVYVSLNEKVHGFSIRCIKTCPAPPVPDAGQNAPSKNQVIWNWNSLQGATGYKWNTTNDLNTATDLGTATSKTETGLACDSLYTRYVWAYNDCGISEVLTLTQSTLPCVFACGDSITVNHIAGLVAPVTKTTTYGTVNNIPGEETKCWITSNLGSDHQATSVDDASEASAGWYWQFNRKQGYKYDGSTLTPAWTITSIIENSDWLTANDPCNLEFGSAWRLPTYTEWYNVDNTGGWTNWNGPWGSGLKLHAAGYLHYSNGSLLDRGSNGYYWSSMQYSTDIAWLLGFHSSDSHMGYGSYKAFGFSARCIKDTCTSYSSTDVSIEASVNPICAETAVTFTTTPTNGGSTPFYQWKVNGVFVGTNSASFSYTPTNGDSIRCIMTSSAPCTSNPASSNTIIMTVNPVFPVSISITASANPFIPGSTVTFAATTLNPGTSPIYQWIVNGINVGNNSNSFSYIPANGDSVWCELTSDAYCVTGNQAVSNKLFLEVIPGEPCSGLPVVTYEGKTYNTVQVGQQCWMRENLDVGIKVIAGQNHSDNGILEKYCYDNLDSNCGIYGGLYQWAEAIQYLNGATSISTWNPVPVTQVQGICPEGWHIPDVSEWNTMITFLGGESVAGSKLKESGTTHWAVPNNGANNVSGFTGLPAGCRNTIGGFDYISTETSFWVTNNNATTASLKRLDYNSTYAIVGAAVKSYGFSIRCIRNCNSSPTAPIQGAHTINQADIIWTWSSVSGAIGYKWNTINDYGSATDMGAVNMKAETGLTCNFSYIRYVWAYNDCGQSTPSTLTATTSACPWVCGQSITVNHIAGEVAPVNKTTTYATVAGIPGETEKCWITRNLGATQQATSVSDATEASAGWYWQFNRKQGYKHDGTNRTPNTTWIASITENSNWQSVNDPCNLELGTTWRLPTYTEWYNVYNTGGWTNWNGPWGSGLKLHAAGYLHTSNGSLGYRGSDGTYWCSTQYSTAYGWYLYFYSGTSYMNNAPKSNGFPVRCLRDN